MLQLTHKKSPSYPYLGQVRGTTAFFLVLKPDLAYCVSSDPASIIHLASKRSDPADVKEMRSLDLAQFTVVDEGGTGSASYPHIVHYTDPEKSFGIRFNADFVFAFSSNRSGGVNLVHGAAATVFEKRHPRGTKATVTFNGDEITACIVPGPAVPEFPCQGFYRGVEAIAFSTTELFFVLEPTLCAPNPKPDGFAKSKLPPKSVAFTNDGLPFSGMPKVLVKTDASKRAALQIGNRTFILLQQDNPTYMAYWDDDPLLDYALAPAGSSVTFALGLDQLTAVTSIASDYDKVFGRSVKVVWKSGSGDTVVTSTGLVATRDLASGELVQADPDDRGHFYSRDYMTMVAGVNVYKAVPCGHCTGCAFHQQARRCSAMCSSCQRPDRTGVIWQCIYKGQ